MSVGRLAAQVLQTARSVPRRPARPARLSLPALVAVSLLYATVMVLMPWDRLHGEPLWDLRVYLDGFDIGAYEYLDELEGLLYLLSEPAWRAVVAWLHALTGSFESALGVVTFASAGVYCFVMLRAHGGAAILLGSPLLIDFFVSQLRSALAGTLFFIAVSSRRPVVWVLMLVVSAAIHTASLVLFGLYGLAFGLAKLSRRRRGVALAATGLASIVLPLAFVTLYAGVLGEVGDRRAETEAAWPGGLFVATFALYYVVLLANLRRVVVDPALIFAFLITGFFVISAGFEFNGLRFIAVTFPSLVQAAFRMPRIERWVLLAALLVMTVYHLFLWLA